MIEKQIQKYFIPVGILFQTESEDKLRLHFSNADSVSVFCGMHATLEGDRIRQKLVFVGSFCPAVFCCFPVRCAP